MLTTYEFVAAWIREKDASQRSKEAKKKEKDNA